MTYSHAFWALSVELPICNVETLDMYLRLSYKIKTNLKIIIRYEGFVKYGGISYANYWSLGRWRVFTSICCFLTTTTPPPPITNTCTAQSCSQNNDPYIYLFSYLSVFSSPFFLSFFFFGLCLIFISSIW